MSRPFRIESSNTSWETPIFNKDIGESKPLKTFDRGNRPGDLFRVADDVRIRTRPERIGAIDESEHYGKLRSW